MTGAERINEEFVRRKELSFIGYNVKFGSRAYGMLKSVPDTRIEEMPVDEAFMAGYAIGKAMMGKGIPVLMLERLNFIYNCLDELVNHADVMDELSKGEFRCPLITVAVVHYEKRDFRLGEQHTSGPGQVSGVCMLFNGTRIYCGVQGLLDALDNVDNCPKLVLIMRDDLRKEF